MIMNNKYLNELARNFAVGCQEMRNGESFRQLILINSKLIKSNVTFNIRVLARCSVGLSTKGTASNFLF